MTTRVAGSLAWLAKCGAIVALVLASLGLALATAVPARAAETQAGIPLSWARESPLLALGSRGPEVRTWQQAMNTWLGAVAPDATSRLVIDGDYGALTDLATRRFQLAQHIPTDGIVGPVTRAAYLSAPALVSTGAAPAAHEPFLALGDIGPLVGAWQQALDHWIAAFPGRGAPIAVDGSFGPLTDAATRQFQQSQGVTVDGFVGPETRAAMASAPSLAAVGPSAGRPEPQPKDSIAPPSVPNALAESPAAGICATVTSPIAEIVLEIDVSTPRCLTISQLQWLRVVNEGPATHVQLGALALDLSAGATVTSRLPVGAYVSAGVHTMTVSRYGGSGPDVAVR